MQCQRILVKSREFLDRIFFKSLYTVSVQNTKHFGHLNQDLICNVQHKEHHLDSLAFVLTLHNLESYRSGEGEVNDSDSGW